MLKKVIYIMVLVVLSSCALWEQRQQDGVVLEIAGKRLMEGDVAAMTIGLTGEDSARVADAYIQQWAEEILVYEMAKENVDPELEAMVEGYRRSLYVHDYEQRLIAQRMSKYVPDSVVEQFYTQHQEQFVLRESIVKGLLLVVANDAPKLADMQKTMEKVGTENRQQVTDNRGQGKKGAKRKEAEEPLEVIEKYAYQYGTGYELFLDEWKTANSILVSMPFEKNTITEELKRKNQIVLSDSLSTYILQVTDKRLPGELMPKDYARPQIEQVVLQNRQVEFLQGERNRLYERMRRNNNPLNMIH